MEIRPLYSRWIEQNRASNRKSNQPSLLPLCGNNTLVGCYNFKNNSAFFLMFLCEAQFCLGRQYRLMNAKLCHLGLQCLPNCTDWWMPNYFIWVFNVCQSTHLGVSNLQRGFEIYKCRKWGVYLVSQRLSCDILFSCCSFKNQHRTI